MLEVNFYLKSGETLTHNIGIVAGSTPKRAAENFTDTFSKLDILSAIDHLTGVYFVIRIDDVSALTIKIP